MKKIIIMSIVFSLSCAGWSATKVPATNYTVNAVMRTNMLTKTGGFIKKAGAGPKVTFVNVQKRIPVKEFASVEARWEQILRIPHQIIDQGTTTDAVKLAMEMSKNSAYAVVIVVTDQAGLPSLLVAPESRWAVVNVAALEPDSATAEILASRLRKEMSRAYGYTMGAINTSLPACVLKPIFGVQDLDAIKYEYVGVEAAVKVLNQARKMGIEPVSATTYRKAVEEGWAPMPTNQWQRAVWESVKGSANNK